MRWPAPSSGRDLHGAVVLPPLLFRESLYQSSRGEYRVATVVVHDTEGSYHGKGIYDLKAFHSILSGRFPEAHLLSHDLIEGAHVRVGLASDIELLDFSQ